MPEPDGAEPLPTLTTHTAEAIERAWRERVYRGERIPQLTVRAVLTGAGLGAVTGLSNLYVGLKVGWSMGVVLTATILGWAVWQGLGRLGLWRTTPSILEANAMASTASAAGYSTGTTLAAAMTAVLLVTGEPLPLWSLMAWVLSISLLGLLIAVPLRRVLIDAEQLPFPSGAAAAQTLRSLYRDRSEDASSPHSTPAATRARALVVALAVGLGLKLLTSVLPQLSVLGWSTLPTAVPTPAMQQAVPVLGSLAAYGWALEISVLVPAAGVLVGWRVAWSIGLGALVCFGLLAPRLVHAGVVASPGYLDVVAWSVWPGVTLMTVAGVLGLEGRWRRVLLQLWRSLWGGLWGSLWRSRAPSRTGTGTRPPTDDPLADIEVPPRGVAVGLLVVGSACVVLQVGLFDVSWGAAVLAVALAVILTVVAARVTGQTDITPIGPLGKVAQLAGGLTMPGQVAPGLMSASVTAGAAASAADLLTDLKSGHQLGAHPRRQFLAQLAGVLVGVAVIVPVFRLVLLPDAAALEAGGWPAPAARIWASVSTLTGQGLSAVPPSARWASAIAAVMALGLAGLERYRPAWRPALPSATGIGLAFVLPASSALSFLLGGLVAWAVARRRPEAMVEWVIPVAAGLIAGESLMGIVAALLTSWAR
ncbi:MAG: OPT family oligopeptide transporter [Myxococcota bacterium]